MDQVGLVIFILGLMLATAGYAGVLLRALKMGIFWALALLIIPFFVFVLLFMDFHRTWKPLLLNFVGGLISQIGLVIWVLAVSAEHSPAPASRAVRDTGAPAVPGAYVPPAAEEAGFLATVDPMLFALLGGLFVFGIVGLAVGGILIGGMQSPQSPHEPAS
jgi:hypothetical protein